VRAPGQQLADHARSAPQCVMASALPSACAGTPQQLRLHQWRKHADDFGSVILTQASSGSTIPYHSIHPTPPLFNNSSNITPNPLDLQYQERSAQELCMPGIERAATVLARACRRAAPRQQRDAPFSSRLPEHNPPQLPAGSQGSRGPCGNPCRDFAGGRLQRCGT
jgi:hypothetical protein